MRFERSAVRSLRELNQQAEKDSQLLTNSTLSPVDTGNKKLRAIPAKESVTLNVDFDSTLFMTHSFGPSEMLEANGWITLF